MLLKEQTGFRPASVPQRVSWLPVHSSHSESWGAYYIIEALVTVSFPFCRHSQRDAVCFAGTVGIKYAGCQYSSEVVNFDWILCYITTWHLT